MMQIYKYLNSPVMSAPSSPCDSAMLASVSWKANSWYKVLPLRFSLLVWDFPMFEFGRATGDVAFKTIYYFQFLKNMKLSKNLNTESHWKSDIY